MTRRSRYIAGSVLAALVGSCFWLWATSPTPQFSKWNPLKRPETFEKLLKVDPPVTTSLSDAVTEVPFLDSFYPVAFRSMTQLPRGEKQAFVMSRPGHYAYEALSYCLKAGAHGPGKGSGLLYAPLKGKWAGIIDSILIRAVEHPVRGEELQAIPMSSPSRFPVREMVPMIAARATFRA